MKWIAHFKDYAIKQFDNNGNEIRYKEVLDDIDNLRTFVIMDDDGDCYSLDLKTQEFKFNDNLLLKSNLQSSIKFSYYRKNTMNLGDSFIYVIQYMGIENDKGDYVFIEIDQQNKQYRFSTNQ